MNLAESNVKKLKKVISLFLSAVIMINICSIIALKTSGYSTDDANVKKSDIIEKAAAYLFNQKNSDHSIGDNKTINDTSDALTALRATGKTGYDDSLQWLSENISDRNTDMTARYSSAAGNPDCLNSIKEMQNDDGGFGLYPEYASDVMDSVLVLEAINDASYSSSDISCEKLCSYLMNSVNSDGGFSYTNASESDYILTSMVVYNVGRFLYANDYDISALNDSMDYLRGKMSCSYTDSSIENTIYFFLVLRACHIEFDVMNVIEELGKYEKADGSFAGSIHTTSLAIRLLSSLDLENSVSITGFNTVLSNTEGNTDKSASITAETTINYISNYDSALDLNLKVYNGKNVIYENNSKVTLPESETSLILCSGDFRLSEPSNDGVYVLVELFNGQTALKTQKIPINMSENETVNSTEVSNLSVELDSYSAFCNSDIELGVSYDLLYATNVDQNVEMKTIVTKDNKEVTSANDTCILVPEKNILSGTPLSFKPDTSEEGKYTVTVICLCDSKEICRQSAEFSIQAAPVINDKTDENTENQFEVAWFGPLLSDYFVFSGNETEINAGAEINYSSNYEFTGRIELLVYKEKELIAENISDIILEEGIPTYYQGRVNYPVYKSNSQYSFTVKNTGEYDVCANLYDADGKLVSKGKCTLTVMEKPVQKLVLNSSVDEATSDMVNFSWNDISNGAESYSYQFYRRTDGTKWEPRSIWNEEEKIKVLNIYPRQPYLEGWMNTTINETEFPAGKGIFGIDSVHIPEYNTNPYGCLLNDDGTWKYDVIFFGSYDNNDGYDLDPASTEPLQQFIDSGRGVLFGHDTMSDIHNNFDTFAEQAGLKIIIPDPIIWHLTTSASVIKIGTLTNYPWTIRGNLTVPETHTTCQFLNGATEWVTLNTEKQTDPKTGVTDGFYLCTNKNLGMIQTGHSLEQASDDERKILANTLFYLYQISQQTTAKDASFYDIDAPDKPEIDFSQISEGKMKLDISSSDNKTEYEYYISANPKNINSESVLSNIRKHEALSGLKGFVVEVNNSSEPDPDMIRYDENREFVLNIHSADSEGHSEVTVSPTDLSEPQYIHVFAVDNANNVSEELIMPFSDTELVTNIQTDKTLYSYGDTVDIDTYTISSPFGRTADMKIEIFDEFDNKTTEISSSPQQILEADQRFETSAEWIVPDDLVGRYKAVISWNNGDSLLAEAETNFKIADDESIFNSVSSDKSSYLVSEPVNLENIVYNKSKKMVENDLVLSVKVYNADDSSEVVKFEHSVGMINTDSSADYSDSIAPDILGDGNYRVIASVMQGDVVVSSDTSEFTVTDSSALFKGKLEFMQDGKSVSADFSVTNTGMTNADNALITVKVYKEGVAESIYTYSDTVSIGAGESLNRSFRSVLPLPSDGKYNGVLSVNYKDSSSDLDYDGFDILPEVTVTKQVTNKSVTNKSVSDKSVKAKRIVNSPKTGGNDIPLYMWMITIFSIAGLIVTNITGGRKNEKD